MVLGFEPLCYQTVYSYGMQNKNMLLVTETGSDLLSDYCNTDKLIVVLLPAARSAACARALGTAEPRARLRRAPCARVPRRRCARAREAPDAARACPRPLRTYGLRYRCACLDIGVRTLPAARSSSR